MRCNTAEFALLCTVSCLFFVAPACAVEAVSLAKHGAHDGQSSDIPPTAMLSITVNEANNGDNGDTAERPLPSCMVTDVKCQKEGGDGCYMAPSMRFKRDNHGLGGCCVPACDGCRLGVQDGETFRGADLLIVPFSKGKGYPPGCPQFVCADKGDKSPFVGRKCEGFPNVRPTPPADTVIEIMEQKGSMQCVENENFGVVPENRAMLWVDQGCGATFRYHGVVKDCVAFDENRKQCDFGDSQAMRELLTQNLKVEPAIEEPKLRQKKKTQLHRTISTVKNVESFAKTLPDVSQKVKGVSGKNAIPPAATDDDAEDPDDKAPGMSTTCASKWAKFLPHLKSAGFFGAYSVGTPDYARAYSRAQNKFRSQHCMCDSTITEASLSADGFIEPLCDGTLVAAPKSTALRVGEGLILAKKDPQSNKQRWVVSKDGEIVSQDNPEVRIGVRGGCTSALAAKPTGKDHPVELQAVPVAGAPKNQVGWSLGLGGKISTDCPQIKYVLTFKDGKCKEGTPLVIAPKHKLLTYQKWNLAKPAEAAETSGDDCAAAVAWREQQEAKRLTHVIPQKLPTPDGAPNPKPWAMQSFIACRTHSDFCRRCEGESLNRIGAANDSAIADTMSKNASDFDKREEIDSMTVVDPRAAEFAKNNTKKVKMQGEFRHKILKEGENPNEAQWGPEKHKPVAKREPAKHSALMHGLTVAKDQKDKTAKETKTDVDANRKPSAISEDDCKAASLGFPPNCVRVKGNVMDAAFLSAPEMFCTLNGQPFFKYPQDIRWINYHTKVVRRSGEKYDDVEGSFVHPAAMPPAHGSSHRRLLQLADKRQKTDPGHPMMDAKFKAWGFEGESAMGALANTAMSAISSGLLDKALGKTKPLEQTAHLVDFGFSYVLPKDFEKALLAMTDAKVMCMNTSPDPEASDYVSWTGNRKGGRVYFSGRIEGGCAALASSQSDALERTDAIPPVKFDAAGAVGGFFNVVANAAH